MPYIYLDNPTAFTSKHTAATFLVSVYMHSSQQYHMLAFLTPQMSHVLRRHIAFVFRITVDPQQEHEIHLVTLEVTVLSIVICNNSHRKMFSKTYDDGFKYVHVKHMKGPDTNRTDIITTRHTSLGLTI